jgi:hypothetical protein
LEIYEEGEKPDRAGGTVNSKGSARASGPCATENARLAFTHRPAEDQVWVGGLTQPVIEGHLRW